MYFVEKHDIVLYYCTADDSSKGVSYVHKLCDSGKGEHKGALSLVKIVERSVNYEHLHLSSVHEQKPTSLRLLLAASLLPSSPELSSVFHPPKSFS